MPTSEQSKKETNWNKKKLRIDGYIDYNIIVVPDKPDKELSCNQRRAKLLQLIIMSGSPWAVTKASYGRMFGVSTRCICNDFIALEPSMKLAAAEITKDMPTYTKILFSKVAKDLLNDKKAENKFKAVQTTKMLNEFLMEMGELDRKPIETISNTNITMCTPVEIRVIMPNDIQTEIAKINESKITVIEPKNTEEKKDL